MKPTNRATALLDFAASLNTQREVPTKGAARISLLPVAPLLYHGKECVVVAVIDLHMDHVIVRVECSDRVVAVMDWHGKTLGWSTIRGPSDTPEIARHLEAIKHEIESRLT